VIMIVVNKISSQVTTRLLSVYIRHSGSSRGCVAQNGT